MCISGMTFAKEFSAMIRAAVAIWGGGVKATWGKYGGYLLTYRCPICEDLIVHNKRFGALHVKIVHRSWNNPVCPCNGIMWPLQIIFRRWGDGVCIWAVDAGQSANDCVVEQHMQIHTW